MSIPSIGFNVISPEQMTTAIPTASQSAEKGFLDTLTQSLKQTDQLVKISDQAAQEIMPALVVLRFTGPVIRCRCLCPRPCGQRRRLCIHFRYRNSITDVSICRQLEQHTTHRLLAKGRHRILLRPGPDRRRFW